MESEAVQYSLVAIGVLLIYPLIYDGTQLYAQKPSGYFRDFWNFVDIGHIVGGYFNIYI